MNKCNYCKKELVNTRHFCNLECETNYRNETQELCIVSKNYEWNWYCPIIDFEETDDELIFSNDFGNTYHIKKSNIGKWILDQCTCIQEFMDMDIYYSNKKWNEVN